MWPLEFTATPVASPRWRSGGSFRKSGTEWKRISAVCWAKAGMATNRAANRMERFMEFNLVILFVRTRIIRAFEKPVACSKFELGFGGGSDGGAAARRVWGIC